MTDSEHSQAPNTEPVGYLATAVNILTSPIEAFDELNQRPSKLFPLALIMISTMAVMFWQRLRDAASTRGSEVAQTPKVKGLTAALPDAASWVALAMMIEVSCQDRWCGE